MNDLAGKLRCGTVILLFFLGAGLAVGCAEKAKPEPTQNKEERRMKEKETMHREMQNK